MDPNECLRLIVEATDPIEATEHCHDLAEWLRKGGFPPKHPEKYWPGTNTYFAILDPMADTQNRWLFVRYSLAGERVESWELAS